MATGSRHVSCILKFPMQHWGSHTDRRPRELENSDYSTTQKVIGTLNNMSNIAWAILQARGRVRPMDYVAIGVKAVSACADTYRIWHKEKASNFHIYFRGEKGGEKTEWKTASGYVASLALTGMDIDAKVVEAHREFKGGKLVSAAWTAVVDGIEIGWVGPPDQETVPDTLYSKTPGKLREVAARRLWDKAGDDRIIRIQGERAVPHYLPPALVETEFIRMVEARAMAFIHANEPWAIILDGEPGGGKTTAAGHLAQKMGFRTVVVNADDLCKQGHDSDGIHARGMELAEMLKPDIIIVNDIDRVEPKDQLALLDFFDNSKGFAKLVFATTNRYRDLIEPVRRPGRLDDLITVPGLDYEEIQRVAPAFSAHADRMLGWPIAYVRNMQKRYEVIGERAFEELDDMARRLSEVRTDGNYAQARHNYAALSRMMDGSKLLSEEQRNALVDDLWPSGVPMPTDDPLGTIPVPLLGERSKHGPDVLQRARRSQRIEAQLGELSVKAARNHSAFMEEHHERMTKGKRHLADIKLGSGVAAPHPELKDPYAGNLSFGQTEDPGVCSIVME